jgi:hypothetical protein
MPQERRSRRSQSKEIKLEAEKDSRLGLTLMRPIEEILLTTSTRFVVMPGEKGRGWRLVVYDE